MVPVYKGTGDREDPTAYVIERRRVPMVAPALDCDGALMSHVVLRGLRADLTTVATLARAAASPAWLGTQGRKAELLKQCGAPHVAPPVAVSAAFAAAGHSSEPSSAAPSAARGSGADERCMRCKTSRHSAAQCLQQFRCATCQRTGHKTGDCVLKLDARLAKYFPLSSTNREGVAPVVAMAATGGDGAGGGDEFGRFPTGSVVPDPRPTFDFEGCFVVLDVGASAPSCSRGWLEQHAGSLCWTEVPTPHRVIRTAAGACDVVAMARIPAAVGGMSVTFVVDILETPVVTPLLLGNRRLIELGACFNYSSGVLCLPGGAEMRFTRSANDLFFAPLVAAGVAPSFGPHSRSGERGALPLGATAMTPAERGVVLVRSTPHVRRHDRARRRRPARRPTAGAQLERVRRPAMLPSAVLEESARRWPPRPSREQRRRSTSRSCSTCSICCTWNWATRGWRRRSRPPVAA